MRRIFLNLFIFLLVSFSAAAEESKTSRFCRASLISLASIVSTCGLQGCATGKADFELKDSYFSANPNSEVYGGVDPKISIPVADEVESKFSNKNYQWTMHIHFFGNDFGDNPAAVQFIKYKGVSDIQSTPWNFKIEKDQFIPIEKKSDLKFGEINSYNPHFLGDFKFRYKHGASKAVDFLEANLKSPAKDLQRILLIVSGHSHGSSEAANFKNELQKRLGKQIDVLILADAIWYPTPFPMTVGSDFKDVPIKINFYQKVSFLHGAVIDGFKNIKVNYENVDHMDVEYQMDRLSHLLSTRLFFDAGKPVVNGLRFKSQNDIPLKIATEDIDKYIRSSDPLDRTKAYRALEKTDLKTALKYFNFIRSQKLENSDFETLKMVWFCGALFLSKDKQSDWIREFRSRPEVVDFLLDVNQKITNDPAEYYRWSLDNGAYYEGSGDLNKSLSLLGPQFSVLDRVLYRSQNSKILSSDELKSILHLHVVDGPGDYFLKDKEFSSQEFNTILSLVKIYSLEKYWNGEINPNIRTSSDFLVRLRQAYRKFLDKNGRQDENEFLSGSN
ncbi:MAG: hypothetical protein J0L93_10560 [Deltaproteobacteria bacterium]|nr:hypothetical protein [Deltaproteobacteria bacterium]